MTPSMMCAATSHNNHLTDLVYHKLYWCVVSYVCTLMLWQRYFNIGDTLTPSMTCSATSHIRNLLAVLTPSRAPPLKHMIAALVKMLRKDMACINVLHMPTCRSNQQTR